MVSLTIYTSFCTFSSNVLVNGTSLVDKIMLCFKNTNLPKTPFVLSLILAICKKNTEFVPVNEAVVMENFMEMLLEKINSDEAKTSTYDFRNKEDFLIYLISYMLDNDCFWLTEKQFQTLLFQYHQKIGFDIIDTKFDKLFFEKGVLVRTTNNISFRYSCMVEYYIAKKAMKDTEFLKFILTGENYLNFCRELSYYTGLNREDNTVINAIEPNLVSLIHKQLPILSELSNYKIGIDFSMTEEKFKTSIIQKQFPLEETDELTDSNDLSEVQRPEKISKQQQHKSIEKFINTLLLYGTILKNSELLTIRKKSDMLENYISGLCICLAILKNKTEETSKKLSQGIKNGDETGSEKNEVINKKIKLTEDIIKICLPLVIGNVALENLGSVKLKSVLFEYIKKSNDNSFEKFIIIFLFVDLRMKDSISILKDFVKKIHTKDLLKIVFFKIMYYYQFRYFCSSLDKEFEDMLAEINIKMKKQSKFNKSQILDGIRKLDREII